MPLIAHCGTTKIGREDLKHLPVPESTGTFKPIPHHELVDALIETLSFRKIGVVKDEYAASADGMKLFGVLDLENGFEGCRFSIGLRNANDRSMRLALTVGVKVFICDNLSFQGEFTPVLAKHSKNFSILDSMAIGVDRMQRNFEPMRSTSNSGAACRSRTIGPSSSSMKPLSKETLKRRGIWRETSTTITSTPSSKSSLPGPCGVWRMPLPRP